jgi:hypothetical protein
VASQIEIIGVPNVASLPLNVSTTEKVEGIWLVIGTGLPSEQPSLGVQVGVLINLTEASRLTGQVLVQQYQQDVQYISSCSTIWKYSPGIK